MGKLILMGIFFVAAAPVVALGLVGGALTNAAIKLWEAFKGVN